MFNDEICIHNRMIDCKKKTECSNCNWNPTYFEEKKRKAREERKQRVKDYEKKTTVL